MQSESCVRRSFRLGIVVSSLLFVVTLVYGQDTKAPLQGSSRLRAIPARGNKAVSKTSSEALLQAQMHAQQLEIELLTNRIKGLEAMVGRKSDDEPTITINPTNGVVPYRANATTFADSPLFVDVNGNLGFGFNPTAPLGNNALTIVGTSDPDGDSGSIEIHNNFAKGIDLYVHDPLKTHFRAPVIAMYTSVGTQQNPIAVVKNDEIGYPASVFGWDGSDWGLGFQVQVSAVENFTPSDHTTIATFAVTGGLNPQRVVTMGSDRIILWKPVNFSGAGIAPASSGVACSRGDFVYDDNYLYLCGETNSWKRAALTTW